MSTSIRGTARVLALLCAALLVAGRAHAAEARTASAPAAKEPAAKAPAPEAPAAPAYVMPSTHAFEVLSDDGRPYRIFVSYPSTEKPADGWPVLYVLDGNAMFAAFADARRLQEWYDVGKAIVVGVGYPGDLPYDVRRLDDYTPPLLDPPPANLKRFAKYPSGGWDRFLDFLTGRLRNEIARRYSVDPARQALFGHSLGGLLALHALYTRPQAFQSIIAASPSLDWDDEAELRDERAFAARLAAGQVGGTSRLMVVVGGRDIDDDPEMAAAMVRRLDALSQYGLRVRIHRYEEEGHLGVPVRAVTDTLRFAIEARW